MSTNPFAADDNPSSLDANPYRSPRITTAADDGGGADLNLDRTATMLRQTRPWVRFISVICFIVAILSALGGLAFIALGIASRMPGPAPLGAMMGFVYILMAVFYGLPGVFLWMYAGRIGIFLRQRTPGNLASALAAQKSFWKFVGIVVLIILCVYFLMALVLAGGVIVSL